MALSLFHFAPRRRVTSGFACIRREEVYMGRSRKEEKEDGRKGIWRVWIKGRFSGRKKRRKENMILIRTNLSAIIPVSRKGDRPTERKMRKADEEESKLSK